MLTIEGDVLLIDLPQGKDQGELISQCETELAAIEKDLYGKEIKINGRLTTGMALLLGHRLAHVCKNVSVFDPKENCYFLAVHH